MVENFLLIIFMSFFLFRKVVLVKPVDDVSDSLFLFIHVINGWKIHQTSFFVVFFFFFLVDGN